MGRMQAAVGTTVGALLAMSAACAPTPGGLPSAGPAAVASIATGPVAPLQVVSVRLSGAYTYEASGPIVDGSLVVARDGSGAVAGLHGNVRIPGRGADRATITFDVDLSAALGNASGTIDVEDPAAGIAVTTPLLVSPTSVGDGSVRGSAEGNRLWRLIEARPFHLEWSVTDGTAAARRTPPLPTATSGSIDLVTYNVAGLPEPLSSSQPGVNSVLISPRLNAFDLALLQEDFGYQPEIASELTHPYGSTPQRMPLGSDATRPSALVGSGLERYSRSPFTGYTQVRWPGCYGGVLGGGAADCLSEKGFSFARHEVAAGVFVDVYDLHGEAGSTPEDDYWSEQDWIALAEYINAHSAGRAVIVGGDFNLHIDEPDDAAKLNGLLAATGLVDVCSVRNCRADPYVIDRILVRSGDRVRLTPTRWWRPAGFERADGAPLSDHEPTAARVAWRVVG